jgi:hypothetical protein
MWPMSDEELANSLAVYLYVKKIVGIQYQYPWVSNANNTIGYQRKIG